jgi:Predicted signaling protein consisting of a modified GGDEF domain and a DHH domain
MKKTPKIRGIVKVNMILPIVLSLLICLMNIAVWIVNKEAGIIMSGLSVVALIVSLISYFTIRSKLILGIAEYAKDFSHIQKQFLVEVDIPYGIMNESGKLYWTNEAFNKILINEHGRKRTILTILPNLDMSKTDWAEENLVLETVYNENYYKVTINQIQVEDKAAIFNMLDFKYTEKCLYAVYVSDDTKTYTYKNEIQRQQLVAGLIYLDNYEEALESVEEVRHSLLIALIDRKVNKYLSVFCGIVKKIEKDKYFVVFKQQHVDRLREERFSLLEEVKTVNIGNDIAITLSIGLGVNGSSYSQNYEYARIAIDMALGRGGDQAVIKDADRITYYGGKSRTTEKNTRVKARVKAHAMRELINTKDRILIMGHKIGDVDALGAGIGVWRIANSLNKKANIIFNEVTSSIKPMMDKFTMSDKYPEDMFIKSDKAMELVDINTMLVIVDVNRPTYTETPELLDKIKTIVVLDHHRQSSEIIHNATLSYIEPYASSTCEMVAEILQYIADDIRIKQIEADAMYAGIVIDTNNFMNKTGVRTFEAAAYLRRNGADVVRVRKLFRDKPEDYKARLEATYSAEFIDSQYAISISPNKGIESPTIVAAQVANELLNISGIKASFVLTEHKNTIYISARSIDEVNVQIIMERLGGGGHMTIAGAQLNSVSLDEGKELIKSLLRELESTGDL